MEFLTNSVSPHGCILYQNWIGVGSATAKHEKNCIFQGNKGFKKKTHFWAKNVHSTCILFYRNEKLYIIKSTTHVQDRTCVHLFFLSFFLKIHFRFIFDWMLKNHFLWQQLRYLTQSCYVIELLKWRVTSIAWDLRRRWRRPASIYKFYVS